MKIFKYKILLKYYYNKIQVILNKIIIRYNPNLKQQKKKKNNNNKHRILNKMIK